MTDRRLIIGSILAVRDYGTLVLVFLNMEDGRTAPIPLDKRAFEWLLESEGSQPDELVGRRISYDGERLLFLDRECSK
jgi:hypothetical protein